MPNSIFSNSSNYRRHQAGHEEPQPAEVSCPDVTKLVTNDHIASLCVFTAGLEEIRVENDQLGAKKFRGKGIQRAARFHEIGFRHRRLWSRWSTRSVDGKKGRHKYAGSSP